MRRSEVAANFLSNSNTSRPCTTRADNLMQQMLVCRKIDEANEDDANDHRTQCTFAPKPQQRDRLRFLLVGLKRLRELFCPQQQQVKILDSLQLQRFIRRLRCQPVRRTIPLPELGGKKILVMSLQGLLVKLQAQKKNSDFPLKSQSTEAEHCTYVRKRFGVEYFLREMAEDYFLIVFSQSNEDECREILAHIDKEKRVKMVLGGPHCTRINNYQAKNLNLFGHELSKIVLLDNSEEAAIIHPDNFVKVRLFNGEERDRQLIQVIPLLKYLSKVEDVRPTEVHQSCFESIEIRICEQGASGSSRLVPQTAKAKIKHQRCKSNHDEKPSIVTTLETQPSVLFTRPEALLSDSSEGQFRLQTIRS